VNFLFVVAHPEPASFTASLARHGMQALEAAGHSVKISDLYAMGFDPVSDRRNFTSAADPDRYDQQVEERHASASDAFTHDLQREMDKLAACDLLVLQFPIWWLGMPAIMKGWIDRVFAIGRTYGGGRWFDRGMMRRKRAMLAVTIGGTADAYSTNGIYGPSADVLRPINHGVLAFCASR
jgi:NAD(P)H dehydrogenase (quinone)